MTNLDSILKNKGITLLAKVHIVKAMVFPVVMYRCELDHKEGWTLKNWCFQTVMLEKTLENPLDSKEIKPVNPKGNQSWMLIGRTDAKLKFQLFGYLMWRADSLEKTLMLRKIESKRRREWQRRTWMDDITDSMDLSLNTLGDSEGQGSLACCSPWGRKELDTTKWLNKSKELYVSLSRYLTLRRSL